MQNFDNVSRVEKVEEVATRRAGDVSSQGLVSWLRGSVDTMPAGSQLPSVRELMRRYRVGPATVGAAFAQLAAEGLVVTLPGRGSFVAPPLSAPESRGDTDWQLTALGERLGTVDELEVNAAAPAVDRSSFFRLPRSLNSLTRLMQRCRSVPSKNPPKPGS